MLILIFVQEGQDNSIEVLNKMAFKNPERKLKVKEERSLERSLDDSNKPFYVQV